MTCFPPECVQMSRACLPGSRYSICLFRAVLPTPPYEKKDAGRVVQSAAGMFLLPDKIIFFPHK